MKASVTIFFFLLFLGVVYLYFYLTPEPDTAVQAPTEIVKLLPLEAEDEIIGLEILNRAQDTRIHLSKRDGGWYVEAPIQDAADNMIVHGMATALKLSAKARRLTPEKDWTEYGLADADIQISIKTSQSDEWKTLLLGDQSPIGKFVYARWQGDEEYFLLDLNLRKVFKRDLFAYRAKKMIQSDLSGLTKLRIETRKENYEMSIVGEEWLWSEPILSLGEAVAPEQLGAVLTRLAGLYVKQYVGNTVPEDVFEYPFAVFKLWSGDAEIEKIVIGRMTPDMNAYVAKRNEEQDAFLMDAEKIGNLLKDVHAMIGEEALL